MTKKILITGAAGFIGYHLAKRLIDDGYNVYGIDNINNYYDTGLKYDRLKNLEGKHNFVFEKIDVADKDKLNAFVGKYQPSVVIHLAAQAGVRYSLENPSAYIESNLVGFGNILEIARNLEIDHLIYASSSSVYGANKKIPFSESDPVNHPVSLYAATKKANELMAHTYSNLYEIPTTGLRFFTVYGPWGRPDMAYFSFTKAIYEGKPINVFNNGNMERDFTYIDDIVEGIVRLIDKIPKSNSAWDYINPDPATSFAPYRIFNIGNNQPVKLLDFISILEELTGTEAKKNFLPMQPGDVKSTFANIDRLNNLTGFKPQTPLKEGLRKFVDWYKNYYKIG